MVYICMLAVAYMCMLAVVYICMLAVVYICMLAVVYICMLAVIYLCMRSSVPAFAMDASQKAAVGIPDVVVLGQGVQALEMLDGGDKFKHL